VCRKCKAALQGNPLSLTLASTEEAAAHRWRRGAATRQGAAAKGTGALGLLRGQIAAAAGDLQSVIDCMVDGGKRSLLPVRVRDAGRAGDATNLCGFTPDL
jgi:hypothetical protein